MPLEDETIGHDSDGALNESYCKWCYADGTYTYSDMDELINVCVKHMVNEHFAEEQTRSYMKELLPSGSHVKFLNEQTTYLGNQLESEFGGERCFGIVANMDFILIATYEAEGTNPELVLFKKR